MLGRRKKDSDAMEAELRKATLRRLAEVVGLPAEDFETTKPAKLAPSKAAPGTRTEAESGAQPPLYRRAS
jgi:hypothetical protein